MNTLNFWDFDGTFCHSPMPDPGKALWAEYHGKPYPHQGWWGREESLDLDAFAINLRDEIHAEYLKYEHDPTAHNYILTSRQPKLRPYLAKILAKFNITMKDILCAHGSMNKGERIVSILNEMEAQGQVISVINFWDDRNKEIVLVEAFRSYFEGKGITLNVYKLESDATD